MGDKSKAIILAAGEGTRLKKYTRDLPKGMLSFAGKTLIERQIGLLRDAGIGDITIVKGFEGQKIAYPGVKYYVNPDFSSTNMVVSLFCAEEELKGDVIVSYADIIFEPRLLKSIMESGHDITVAVDVDWKRYWLMRYGSTERDAESLRLMEERIISLGRENPSPEEMDARYIGLLRFGGAGVEALKEVYHKYRDAFWDMPWQVSGKTFKNAYMTDMIQALIDEGFGVFALKTKGGWMEMDTNEDFEKALGWLRSGEIEKILRLG